MWTRCLRMTRNVAVALPLSMGMAGVLATPQPALAFVGGNGETGGLGGRPATRLVTTFELLRMNDDTLLDIAMAQYGNRVRVEGPMGVYPSSAVAHAIRYQRERARNLIARLERARTEEQKVEILSGLLRAAKKRHQAAHSKLKKEERILVEAGLIVEGKYRFIPVGDNDNPRVEKYYTLLRSNHKEEWYAEMLRQMLVHHTHEYRNILD